MRAFIAFDMPNEIKAALQAAQTALRAARADVAWTKPDNLHLTLKFFGDLDEARVADVAGATREIAALHAPFELQLDALGFFPHARQPRVVWAGLQGALPPLRVLQARLEQRLVEIGFEPEARGFRPHLTLGRIKTKPRTAELVTLAEQHQLEPLRFALRALVLVRSELHATGARYTTLATLPLLA
jgi:2'-5' RNA ligase